MQTASKNDIYRLLNPTPTPERLNKIVMLAPVFTDEELKICIDELAPRYYAPSWPKFGFDAQAVFAAFCLAVTTARCIQTAHGGLNWSSFAAAVSLVVLAVPSYYFGEAVREYVRACRDCVIGRRRHSELKRAHELLCLERDKRRGIASDPIKVFEARAAGPFVPPNTSDIY